MITLMTLALLAQAGPSDDAMRSREPEPQREAPVQLAPSYSSMTREQLLRERARLLDARPSGAALPFAYIGTVLCLAGGIVSLVFLGHIGFQDLGPLLIIPTVVGFGLAALLVYYIATRTPLRSHLGNEIDVIDDLLDHPQPAQPMSLWPKNPVPMMTLAQF